MERVSRIFIKFMYKVHFLCIFEIRNPSVDGQARNFELETKKHEQPTACRKITTQTT